MSVTYISAELRRIVIARAENICEYCLLDAENAFFAQEVDHIIGEKHGGLTEAANLALYCKTCNMYKGSDVGSTIPGTQDVTRFYNPRTDKWVDHFALAVDGFTIRSLTPIGEATVRIFAINSANRLEEREILRLAEQYPNEAARRRINGEI